jgi:Protein of unknown function (DUF1592)/Protein of unknown function (DUF1588)/Protein of unknown function (DUF1585)/Protein of unknown function (DUF1587)/Protein of unknown function (DUF1595)/Planctomycete cytochrome C
MNFSPFNSPPGGLASPRSAHRVRALASHLGALLIGLLPGGMFAANLGADLTTFTDTHCSSCHNDVDKEGNLDLTTLQYAPSDPANFLTWVRVHDRVQAGEMPPKEKRRPAASELGNFVQSLATSLTTEDKATAARDGRTTQRRLNRYEFENSLRDLLQAPWLHVKNELPEDGEAELFNKIGDALDVSHVQMTRYMRAANQAMRHTMGIELARQSLPAATTTRYWARDEQLWTRTFHRVINGNPNPERMAFPVLGTSPQPEVRARQAPLTVGSEDPATRELEAVGWMRSNYHPFHTIWDNFRAPVAGKYRVRWSGYTVWVGPNGHSTSTVTKADGTKELIHGEPQWHYPNGGDVSAGRRNEPITVYAQGPIDVRRVGEFDLTPEPAVYDLGVITLAENEALVTDASRFFRNRPGSASNPLAQRDGAPAVAFRWMEVEGPLLDETSTAGYRILFGDLPLKKSDRPEAEIAVQTLMPSRNRGPDGAGGYGRVVRTQDVPVEVVSANTERDTERLLRAFMRQAYRRPVEEADVQRYLGLIRAQMKTGHDFTYSMLAGYTAIICSPGFLYLEETPGRLDDSAVASRLAYFLWNSAPDAALLARAQRGELRRPEVLRTETERLLNDPKSRRLVEAFLDYWLELRKQDATTPSNTLYPDYYLDEALAEAALDESRMFFTELLQKDLPARNVINSDFTYLNERLAEHYGIRGVAGAAMRRVALPADSVRGGVMTQAMVLKVTANGTTTSPVIRGKWLSERILGRHVPAPPAAVPAVDPDTRGAVTIRQQLERHRADESCAVCHTKIDPQGFALESFDVMGAWRDRYRGDAKDKLPEVGLGKNGWAFDFHYALPVEAQGQLPDGQTFKDVREFKRLILRDEAQIARNLARQLAVYATGSPVRFSDRAVIEGILGEAKGRQYGVRSLIHAIVQSDLFLNK